MEQEVGPRLGQGSLALPARRHRHGPRPQRAPALHVQVGVPDDHHLGRPVRAIAAPADIDPAVRLGLGYPKGPLALGDALGPARVLAILQRLQAATGDPRYRPSLWLQRRARLGLPLTAPDLAV